ncbi:hypothetical protein Ahy_B01g052238 [Arachis hypogaea]|uniref:Uncharacterized protein n=1 Tax=Arachis hypogaea TaxID=3818 RepID=A0A445ANX9_ARAHY|nr:hypothetical protein Ahy_B01g052238 [Arachis hypogaea]
MNLALFVTTWMELECDKLIMDVINKNHVDIDEYPFITEPQASSIFYFIHFIFFKTMACLFSSNSFFKI